MTFDGANRRKRHYWQLEEFKVFREVKKTAGNLLIDKSFIKGRHSGHCVTWMSNNEENC